MRLAIICGGRASADIEHNSKPLKYIRNSIETVTETLTHNNWTCKDNLISANIAIDTLDNFSIGLSKIVKNQKVDEFLFYYTGHGKYGNTKSKVDFQLRLESQQVTIGQLVDTIYTVLEAQKPLKIALVIDSCYSGEAITKSTPYRDIEILTSTDDSTKSYEKEGLIKERPNYGISIFSHYFCEAFNTVQPNDEICLELIATHVNICQNEQESYYDGVQGRNKIIIGYNKQINDIKKTLKENFSAKTFKSKILEFLPRENLGFKEILNTKDFDELLGLLLKHNKASLYCIFKELGIVNEHIEKFSEKGCEQLKEVAMNNREVKKVILRISQSSSGSIEECMVEGWLLNNIDTIEPLEVIKGMDFSSDYISLLSQYLKEALDEKFLAKNPLDLDLILDDDLLSHDFFPLTSSRYGFNISIQFLSRNKDFFSSKVVSVWEENSAFLKLKASEKIEPYVYLIDEAYEKQDIQYCFSENKIIVDSSHNLLTTRYIEMIKSFGLPFVVSPTSDVPTKVNFKWQDAKVCDLRLKATIALSRHYNRVKHFEKDDTLECLDEEKNIQFIYDNYHEVKEFKSMIEEIDKIKG